MQENKGKVFLIGAGPGDCGLITKRGSELLKTAEVLLYDRLANPMFLQEVPVNCERILVGKREGEHTASQEEINRLLVQKAKEGKRVIRLKGGDAFVFGRGGEEILALEEEKIPYEVIPGVTSAIAALETAGIPVTHRKTARSFHVITGHTAEELEEERFTEYAALEGTLIFLMGIGNLEKIAELLLTFGKAPDTPAAIVEQGTTVRQRRIDGTLGTIAERARKEKAKAPAIFVVGETASCHMTSENMPLSRCRIGVTGTPHLVEELQAALRELGAQVFGAPFLQIVPTDILAKKKPDWKTIDWLVFTSANGVRQFFEQIHTERVDVRALGHIRYAVIGQGTAEALWQYGIIADYMPSCYTVRELAAGLAKKIGKGEKVCILRAKEGSPDIGKVWEREGIDYEDLAIYETRVDSSVAELLWQQVPILDYITFASASGVRGFFGEKKGREMVSAVPVCIGNKTEEALRGEVSEQERKRIATAKVHTIEGMVQKIAECTERSRYEEQIKKITRQ